jgi:transposase
MLDEVERMFTWWHRVRDGTLARSSFRVYMRTVQKLLQSTARGRRDGLDTRNEQDVRYAASSAATPSGPSSTSRGVEPTNNGAEQVVRHGVIMRKRSAMGRIRGRQSLRQNGC